MEEVYWAFCDSFRIDKDAYIEGVSRGEPSASTVTYLVAILKSLNSRRCVSPAYDSKHYYDFATQWLHWTLERSDRFWMERHGLSWIMFDCARSARRYAFANELLDFFNPARDRDGTIMLNQVIIPQKLYAALMWYLAGWLDWAATILSESNVYSVWWGFKGDTADVQDLWNETKGEQSFQRLEREFFKKDRRALEDEARKRSAIEVYLQSLDGEIKNYFMKQLYPPVDLLPVWEDDKSYLHRSKVSEAFRQTELPGW